MTAAQRFLALFFSILIPVLSGLIFTAIDIQPLDGPLTRMGGYAESDFGWSGQQLTLGVEDVSVPRYQHYTDILVIGDSFSKPGLWQAFLERNTGLSIQTLDLGKTSFSELMKTPAYIETPPTIVVVESVEVFFLTKFRQSTQSCDSQPVKERFNRVLDIKPKSILFKTKERTTAISLDNLNLNYAWSYWKRAILSIVSKQENNSVAPFNLARNDLFSNRLSNKLLVYKPDLEKAYWQKKDVSAAICQVLDLQKQFQSNAKTVFVFALIPDKLTAYTPFISSSNELPQLALNSQLRISGIQAPDLYQEITQAIAKPEKDIYLPNETHFGSRGHEVMATVLQNYLQNLGLIKEAYKN